MLTIDANLRTHYKKNATRKLRKNNKCPAIVYGNNYQNTAITLDKNTMFHPNVKTQLYKNNTILLKIKKTPPITVKIQNIQYHPFKLEITHIDFLKITQNT